MKKRALILFCVSMLCAAAPVYASDVNADTENDNVHTISVTGKSEKTVEPDFAQLSYSVKTEGDTASECQEKNDEAVTKTIDLLKSLGIGESSIQTDFYMNPKYTDQSIISASSIDGYEATTTITVSDVPVDSLGDIIGGSVQTGVNELGQIRYYSSRYDEIYNEALAEAVSMARRKAETIAEAAGCVLAGPPTVSESDYNDYARYSVQDYESSDMASDSAAEAKSISVSPGEITIDAEITAMYDATAE